MLENKYGCLTSLEPVVQFLVSQELRMIQSNSGLVGYRWTETPKTFDVHNDAALHTSPPRNLTYLIHQMF
jgi:hypothetical protein